MLDGRERRVRKRVALVVERVAPGAMKIAALRHMQICRQHASILFRRLKESAFDQMLKQSRINGGYVFLGHILLLETLEVEQNNFINKLHRCSLHGADDALFA